MTLVVALACKDGVVLASESQSTSIIGNVVVKQQVTKIKPFGQDKLWGASGTGDLIQKMEEYFSSSATTDFSFSDEETRKPILDAHTLIAEDAAARHMRSIGQVNREIPTLSLLIVGHENAQPKIWRIAENSSDAFCEQQGYEAIGLKIFAIPVLGQFNFAEYDTEVGSLIAYKTLTEAISISGFGIGGPIDIWTINEDGPHQLNQAELDSLDATYNWWVRTAEEDFKIKVVKRLKSFSAAQ